MNGEASDLANLLTENCLSCLKSVLARNTRQNINIHKEDIFFAWLGKHDEPNWKMTVCTLSFPSYGYSSDKMKALKVSMINSKRSAKLDSDGEKHEEG